VLILTWFVSLTGILGDDGHGVVVWVGVGFGVVKTEKEETDEENEATELDLDFVGNVSEWRLLCEIPESLLADSIEEERE
jgi:hypothetical protein